MTDDPLDWLLRLEHLGMKFGLENMLRLVEALQHPERAFASVHVAGTNGKGSVTAMVETALRAAGHRAARYTSPHLERLEERFSIAGDDVSTGALREAVATVRRAVKAVQQHDPSYAPTFFECATAAAFELFRGHDVEIAVLEAGLGGRLDATNVIVPLVTAITSIDFDHQSLLGSTLAAIAGEKAGIIKAGVPVVIGALEPEAEKVIAAIAVQHSAPVVHAAGAGARLHDLRPALAGSHQRENADIAVAVLEAVRDAGMDVPDTAIRAGIERVRWPARLERIDRGDTQILLDAAHNPGGARALAAYLRDIEWTDAVLVFGAMADKDAAAMIRQLAPAVAAIVCTTAASPRAATAERLVEVASTVAGDTRILVEADPIRAVARAKALSRHVVIAGSIFLVGPLRGILR